MPTGNRETANGSNYSTDTHNRMTFDGKYTYQYDAEGNRTDQFIWSDDGDGILKRAKRRRGIGQNRGNRGTHY